MLKQMSRLTLAVVVTFVFAAAAFAANTPKINIISNTGSLTFKDPKGVTNPLMDGQRIPQGSTISISGGAATLRIGRFIVKLSDGDAISVGKNNNIIVVAGNPQISRPQAAAGGTDTDLKKSPNSNNLQNLNNSRTVSPSSPH